MMSQFGIMDTEIFAKVEGGFGGWEEVAFQKNYMVWLDNHVRILMVALNTFLATNIKFSLIGTVVGRFAGYGKYVLGCPDDYLDITNHRVVSSKTLYKSYQILEND
jgi:hypothetical protein